MAGCRSSLTHRQDKASSRYLADDHRGGLTAALAAHDVERSNGNHCRRAAGQIRFPARAGPTTSASCASRRRSCSRWMAAKCCPKVIPDFEAAALSLQGSWGDQGDTVRFSNVELRSRSPAAVPLEKSAAASNTARRPAPEIARRRRSCQRHCVSDDDRQTVARIADGLSGESRDARGRSDYLAARNRTASRLLTDWPWLKREVAQRAPTTGADRFVLGIAHLRVGEFPAHRSGSNRPSIGARKLDWRSEPKSVGDACPHREQIRRSGRAPMPMSACATAWGSLGRQGANSQDFAGEVTRDLGSIIAEIQSANAEKKRSRNSFGMLTPPVGAKVTWPATCAAGY